MIDVANLDITNIRMVSVSNKGIAILNPHQSMTKEEALVHAAWLVVLADEDNQFSAILDRVKES